MVAAAIAAGAAVVGAGASLAGSSMAAGAARDAAGLQSQTAAANAARSAEFVTIGKNAGNQLLYYNTNGFDTGQPNYLGLSQGAMPGQMTQAELAKTPGYQWQLNQGLQATQQAAAAKGLGASGAALKGAATFATGLADSNYQTQFSNAQIRSQDYINLNTASQGNTMNLYNRLVGTTTLGANAANGVSTNAVQSSNAAGGFLNAAGLDSAAGVKGVASSVNSAAQNYLGYNALQAYLGGGGAGGGNTIQPYGANNAIPGNTIMSAYG